MQVPDPLKTVQDKTMGKAGPVRVLPSKHPDMLTYRSFLQQMLASAHSCIYHDLL